MFQDQVVVITGGVVGVGKCIRKEFENAGATVCMIDMAEQIRVDCMINNALPLLKDISE